MADKRGFSEFVKTLPELLNTAQTVSISPKGASMLPTIREGDKVFLTKAEAFKKYDILLFTKSDGKAILHRLVAKNKDGTLTFQGDTQSVKEINITPDKVVAKVIFIERGGKKIKTSGFWFYIKSFVILHLKYLKRKLGL